MKKSYLIIALLGLINTGCTNNGVTKENLSPPKTFIEVDNERFETILGTYCWSSKGQSECVDKAGPIELLEGSEPIEVSPGESVTFIMEYEPKPNKIYVLQISNNEESEVKVSNNHLSAPTQKGIYYYSYGAWWMDEKKESISNGDANYAFALEVK
ncbi:hypothetical protein [Cytobacillus oceanisediminis]|uniref:hypothetical protein n=1 Tax=Cytobacillus oceanisediminis TaxID=665099 RepID=UPI00203DB0F7|nr:hypothetical protein [Cytobacillus oceanisediminis]MCM3392682.1 hypothetical protein [Cytobacillus oceanisediminis]